MEFLDLFHVVLHHDFDEFFEAGLVGVPAEGVLGFAGVAQQLVHLGGAEVLGVDFHEGFARLRIDAFLVHAVALPFQFDACLAERQGAELAHCVVLACGYDVVVRFRLLQHEPHTLYIVFGVAPVAQGVEVAQVELVLEALGNTGSSQGDLTCDEGLTTALTLMVE